jgi:hypothetical protein
MLIVVWIPLVAIWAFVMVDLVRQRRLSTTARVIWAVVCTLLWPAMSAYLMMRPTSGRIAVPEVRTDPRSRLVEAVLDHEAGRIDDAQMARITSELRRPA